MLRFLFAMLLMLAFTLNIALSAPGRGIPAGEDAPKVIQKVFSSPSGELQFTTGAGGKSVFLRTAEGAVCEVESIEGESACQHFADISDKQVADTRCIFIFEKGSSACRHRIFSYELQESDLFRVVKRVTAAQLEGTAEEFKRAN